MRAPILKRLARTMLSGVALGAVLNAYAAPLQLAEKPLFLGYTVNPNVFFSLDDSGSMDFEVTAVPHWDACRYDDAHPGTCYQQVRDSGDWFVSSYRERKRTTETNWQTNGNPFYAEFVYMFDNNTVNLYGTACDDSNTNVPACHATAANTTSGFTTYNNRFRMYGKDWRGYSSDFNVTYYNPKSTYSPWVRTGMTNASFTAARANPESTQTGYSTTRNLGTTNMRAPFLPETAGFIYVEWTDSHGFQQTVSGNSTSAGPDKVDRTTGPNGIVDVWDNHSRYVVTQDQITRYDVTYTVSSTGLVENVSGPFVVTTDSQGRSLAEVQQNIANWYQYGRRRMFVAKSAMALVIDQNPQFRFGMTMINKTGSGTGDLFVEMPAAAVTDYTTHNTNLITKLYQYKQAALGTPLREGLDNAGRYYSGETLYASGATSLSTTRRTRPITEACQQNFTILFTDGYYNTDGTVRTSVGDRDGDGLSPTLADIAHYYADHDIDTTKANQVPVGNTGTTTFQHMVTYGVAFGVNGELEDRDNDPDHLPDVHVDSATGAVTSFTPAKSVTWGDSPLGTSNTGKIDDLWHAAYNSGGDFISARTPEELVSGLKDALRTIEEKTGSSASVAASSGSYQASTSLFLAKFNSANWSGEVEAYPLVENNGKVSISKTPKWRASERLDNLVADNGFDTNRIVATYNPAIDDGARQGAGVPFRFPSDWQQADEQKGLGLAQLAYLMPYSTSTTEQAQINANAAQGQRLLNWLRGDTSLDGNAADGIYYRERASVLGDIVDSSPQYVAAPERFYPDSLQPGENNRYSAFRAKHDKRTPTVYVGANDGMLHAFRASDGRELFAYIPATVFKRLKNLANPNYTHQYTVNSTPAITDVFINGGWRTVLVGGLGGGGQGIYALDITDPTPQDEADLASHVLWEFSDVNYVPDVEAGAVGSNGDPNLGYTFSRPQLVKMANGKWMAVFGNGYNNTEADGSASTTGRGYIYFVDLETGKLVRRIEVPAGTPDTPNGLATVTVADLNSDYVADYVYAGDLYGNLWRFDVRSRTPSKWSLAYDGKPVFTTRSGQPITTKPAVVRHPTGSGVLVSFGTGKYLEFSDAQTGNQTTQSYYSIWDNIPVSGLGYPVKQSELLQQRITNEVKHASGADVRVTSANHINWHTQRGWYIDLILGASNNGEKIMSDSVVRGDRVIFISVLPAVTACEPGGSSWIYELNYADGSRLAYSPIDVNNDGVIDAVDNVTVGGASTPGGAFKQPSIISSPTILSDRSDEKKVFSSSLGTLLEMGESNDILQGRRSWRQLR